MPQALMILALVLLPASLLLAGLAWLAGWCGSLQTSQRPLIQAPQPVALLPPTARLSRHWLWLLWGFVLFSGLNAFAVASPLLHGVGWLSRYALPALLCWMAWQALQQGQVQSQELAKGLLGGSLLLACIGLGAYFLNWQVLVQSLCWPGYENACLIYLYLKPEARATGLAMHGNLLGILLALSLPLWLWALATVKGLQRLAVFAGLWLVLLCLLVSFSRAAWLSGGLGLLLGSYWLLNASWRLSLLSLLGLAGIGIGLGSPDLLAHVQSLLDPLTGSAGTRLQIWASGLEILRDAPWSGIGLLHFESLYPLYQRGGIPANHIHNWYLQVALESGLPAALLLFALLARLLKLPRLKHTSPLGLAAWLAWLVWLLASWVDCTVFDLRVTWPLMLLLALVLYERQQMQHYLSLRQGLSPEKITAKS